MMLVSLLLIYLFIWKLLCLHLLTFITRCDDNNAKIGDKMIYASTKDTIKKAFTGLGIEFQANDAGDFDYKSFSEEVEKKA